MADKLFFRTQVGITPGTPATLAHGLTASGVAVAPDIYSLVNRTSGSRVAGLTGSVPVCMSVGTDAIVVDVQGQTAVTLDVMAEYLHSIQRTL